MIIDKFAKKETTPSALAFYQIDVTLPNDWGGHRSESYG